MSHGHFAILDPAAGISGDMFLGAVLDAGADPAWLRALPARLGFPEVSVEIERVVRCGIAATKVTVRLPDGSTEEPLEEFHAHDTHGHHHDAGAAHHLASGPGHRHLGELIRILERAPLSDRVREQAVRAFRLLAQEEGAVHGLPPEQVALHEVGAVDALVDIVGAIEGLEQLNVEQLYHRPVALGSGWVRTAHGVMAVPTPVTLRLLEGIEIGPDGPTTGEATTPTGAVLLRVLSAGAPPTRWRAIRSGWGAGGRNPDAYPNALRLIVADAVAEAGEVVTLSTDLDDLSSEYFEPLREALVAAGALDVLIWGTHMKKGRAGFRLEVIVDTAAVDRVTEALFLHSTTAGVRRSRVERVTLPRRQIEIEAAAGMPIRVKILETPGGLRAKPEYDDIAAAARRLGRPAHDLAREIQARALTLIAAAATGGPRTPNEEL